MNAPSTASRSLDYPKGFTFHPAERLAFDEGNPLLKAQILAVRHAAEAADSSD